MEINSLRKIVRNIDDLNDISEVIYINIDIENSDILLLKELIKRDLGKKLFSDSINTKLGNIYVKYDEFFHSAKLIINIIESIDDEYSDMEKARYLYITLGKLISYDINEIPEKNDDFTFDNICKTTNIFSALNKGIGNNESICKLYLYLLRLSGITSYINIDYSSIYWTSTIKIGYKELKVCLPKDIALIKGRFKTSAFDIYNEDKELDKKIKYIEDEYNDIKLDRTLKDISNDNIVSYLNIIGEMLDIGKIKAIEQGIIYDFIFTRYLPAKDILINNLYVRSGNDKNHIIMVSCDGSHYSYNYSMNSYFELSDDVIKNGIDSGKIGYYLGEKQGNLVR